MDLPSGPGAFAVLPPASPFGADISSFADAGSRSASLSSQITNCGSNGTMTRIRHRLLLASLTLSATFGPLCQGALAATAAELNADGKAALSRLYAQSSKAARFGKTA